MAHLLIGLYFQSRPCKIVGHWHPAVGKFNQIHKSLESKIGFVLVIVNQVQLLFKKNKLMKREKEALGD